MPPVRIRFKTDSCSDLATWWWYCVRLASLPLLQGKLVNSLQSARKYCGIPRAGWRPPLASSDSSRSFTEVCSSPAHASCCWTISTSNAEVSAAAVQPPGTVPQGSTHEVPKTGSAVNGSPTPTEAPSVHAALLQIDSAFACTKLLYRCICAVPPVHQDPDGTYFSQSLNF